MNCIVIHGCPSNVKRAMNPATQTYDKHWIPWVREQLNARGIQTETPLMPHPWQPDYEKFKLEFDKYPVSQETILIGHGCGTAFLVRWLGDSKQKIKKLILVAPWKIAEKDDQFRREFYDFTIDPAIKDRVKEIIYFTSDDEEEIGKSSLKIYFEVLGGKIINLPGHGHYTQDDMGRLKFPELLDAVIKNTRS